MSKRAVLQYFKPGLWTVIVLGIFIPVAIFGHIQTYAFTCGGDGHKCVGTDIQKPFLYDQIRGYPFWLIWVFSIAPLIPFTNVMQEALGNFEDKIYVFMAMNFVYYYLASCLIGLLWNLSRRKTALGVSQTTP